MLMCIYIINFDFFLKCIELVVDKLNVDCVSFSFDLLRNNL